MEALRGEILRFGGLTPLFDTPAHIHANEDEYFHIIEGEHAIFVGEEEHRLRPGEGIFAPRGVPHAQRRIDPGVGRLLLVYAPAGFEGFFRCLAAAEADGNLGDAAYAAASEEYGVTWL